MDKGAHFYCCDFQVHTPRDPQWKGKGAATPEQRREYAMEFVAACRSKGINAVAITDHHDMAFIPYIREAAQSEVDEDGRLLQQEEQLVVFPGMELTLGIPCQAIIIFDADFPEDMFSLVRNGLAIQQTDDTEPHCNQAGRLERVVSFTQLYDELNRHEYIRGKFIVLPNVSDKGTGTLLRAGHAGHYKEMPCVGGYLDGSFDRIGTGNWSILSGKNVEYGRKALGIFQTSDNRHRDFVELGKHVTWVKWAAPTAEALRQACLAWESRICQQKPFAPSVIITSINISNSKFLGPLSLEFNPQYNAVIGGRGTGKSTILEYLRWALCDTPISVSEDDDAPDYKVKRRNLIDKTLASFDANVQVNFLINRVPHCVRRHSKDQYLTLKIGHGNFEPCLESDVRSLLPIQAYSQKQLSNIGVRLDELMRFVCSPIRQTLDDLHSRFLENAGSIRAAYTRLQGKRAATQELENVSREILSLNEQIRQLKSNLQGIDPNDQIIIGMQGGYDEEELLIDNWRAEVGRTRTALEFITRSLNGAPTLPPGDGENLPNKKLIEGMQRDIKTLFNTISSLVQNIEDQLQAIEESGSPFEKKFEEWQAQRAGFRAKYDAARTRSAANEITLNQLSDLERRLKHLQERGASIKAQIKAAGVPEEVYEILLQERRDLYDKRGILLEQQCDALTANSGGQIRATLKRCSVVAGIVEKFKTIITGANIRGSKLEKLSDYITATPAVLTQWESLLGELEKLVLFEHNPSAEQSKPLTPVLSSIGFTDVDLKKIASRMTPDSWLELRLMILEDQPVFEYRSREDEYIQFNDASAGQQATALLWALLNQEGPPLIIDQPEDDLDNRVMLEVAEQIGNAKKQRQLLFSSHNANLVVNGNAELVICCDYRVAGEQSSGRVKYEGSIDVDEIREEIASVMEGGKEAFKLRKEKYGY